MSDYTKIVSYTPKDALSAGDAAKRIKGSEMDAELDAIATAVASKEDETNKGAANGYCGLDASGLVAAADLPIATDPETLTGTSVLKVLTPANLEAWAAQNAGLVKDLSDLADPNADRLVFWDDSAGAMVFLTVGTGLAITATTLASDDAAINHDGLSGFVAAEHVDHSAVSITAGNGLTGGGTIEATRDIAVGAGEGIAVSANAVALDLASIVNSIEGNAVAATDEFPVNDGGTTKYITAQGSGVPVDTVAGTTKTLASTDTNRVQYCTNAAATTITLNTSVGVVGNFFVIVQSGAGQVTVAGTATVNSSNGLKTRTQHSVILLLCLAANTWVLYGDSAV